VMVLICNAFSSVLIALLWYSKIRRRIMLYYINSSRMTNAMSHGLIWKNLYSESDRQKLVVCGISCTTACDDK